MALEDEIGSFSNRRLEKEKHNVDEHYDEEDDESEYDFYDFKMYELDELGKLNQEIVEREELISPWWKNLKIIFSKSTLQKHGLIIYKSRYLLSNDTFKDVVIENVEESLAELKIFGEELKKIYLRRFKSNIYGIIFYILLAYWTGWNVVWYFLIGWSLYDMARYYFKYQKEREWLVKAEKFIDLQDENNLESQRENSRSRLEEVMAFNSFISKDESEHWSIKVYDTVANLFKRRK